MENSVPSSKETNSEQSGTVSQLISNLKSSCHLAATDFDRVIDTLAARDEAARKQISHWKTQFESMEKKHGEIALEKIITEDELRKLKRERDFLKDQVARAETDQKESADRERKWKERCDFLMDQVARAETDQKESADRERKWKEKCEKVLELEKEKAEWEAECKRRFEELNRRQRILLRLEEDDASGIEERREEAQEGVGPVAVAEMNDVFVAGELVMDGIVGRNGYENLIAAVVRKESGERAESLPCRGESAPFSVEAGGRHRANGIIVDLISTICVA